MKKFIVFFPICLLLFGCGKPEKNITINIYENSDTEQKEIVKEKIDSETSNKEQTIEVKENKQQFDSSKKNNVSNNQTNITNNNIQNSTNSNNEQSTLSKVTEKVKDNYNYSKDWYNENKDELKDINSEILENDKNTINGWLDSGKNWYNENKDALNQEAQSIYESDKKSLEELYNKIKN